VPIGSAATVEAGRRLLSLLRGHAQRPGAKPRLPCADHPVWHVAAQQQGECSAVLPSLEHCGLRALQFQPGAAADGDDSDEEACAGRRAEVERLWSNAMSGGGGGRGGGGGGSGNSWCMCCRRRCKGGMLKHLRTEQHKRAEEEYVRGGGGGGGGGGGARGDRGGGGGGWR
jgi:hypothetical protein